MASTTSEESFEMMQGAEAEGSVFLPGVVGAPEEEEEEKGAKEQEQE